MIDPKDAFGKVWGPGTAFGPPAEPHNTDGYLIPPTREQLEERIAESDAKLGFALDLLEGAQKRNAVLVEALKKIIVDGEKGDGTSTECNMLYLAQDALKKVGVK